MTMNLDVREVGAVTVVAISGAITSSTAPQLQQALAAQMADGAQALVLDLEHVELTTSAGLRVFLSCAKQMRARGGTFAVCDLNATMREVFEISGFISLLDVFADVEETLESIES